MYLIKKPINGIVLPMLLLLEYFYFIPLLFGLYFYPDKVRNFPNQEQINTYGINSYRELLFKCLITLLIATIAWFINVKLIYKLKQEPEQSKKKSFQAIIILLSIIAGFLIFLTVAMVS